MLRFFLRGLVASAVVSSSVLTAGAATLRSELRGQLRAQLIDTPPTGFISMQSTCNGILGWSCDADTPQQSTWVHLWNGYGAPGASLVGSGYAEWDNGDNAIGTFCGGNRKRVFLIPLANSAKGGQPLSLRAYAINSSNNGNNPELPGSPTAAPLTLTCGQTELGNLDVANTTYIAGWACGRSATSPSTPVDVYANAPAGMGGVYLGRVTANLARPDLGSICGANNLHGWSLPTPLSIRDGQPHKIYAYAIGQAGNPLLPGSGIVFQGTAPVVSSSSSSVATATPQATITFDAATTVDYGNTVLLKYFVRNSGTVPTHVSTFGVTTTYPKTLTLDQALTSLPCNVVNNQVTCQNFASIPVGATVPVTIALKTAGPAADCPVNTSLALHTKVTLLSPLFPQPYANMLENDIQVQCPRSDGLEVTVAPSTVQDVTGEKVIDYTVTVSAIVQLQNVAFSFKAPQVQTPFVHSSSVELLSTLPTGCVKGGPGMTEAICTIGTLAANQPQSFVIRYKYTGSNNLHPELCGTEWDVYKNVIEVRVPAKPPVNFDVPNVRLTCIAQLPTVSVTLMNTPIPRPRGAVITETFKVKNIGPVTGLNMHLDLALSFEPDVDAASAQIVFEPTESSAGCTFGTNSVISCLLPTMNANAEQLVDISYRVVSKPGTTCMPGNSTPLVKNVTAGPVAPASEFPPEYSTNILCDVPLPTQTTLSITPLTLPVEGKVGDLITTKYKIKNTGLIPAAGVAFKTTLPSPEFTNSRVRTFNAGASTPGCAEVAMTDSPGMIIGCSIGTMPVGEERTITIAYTLGIPDESCLMVMNMTSHSATLSATNAVNVSTSPSPYKVFCGSAPQGKVTVDGSIEPVQGQPGDVFTYRIKVKNTSPSLAPTGLVAIKFNDTVKLLPEGTSPKCEQQDDDFLVCADLPSFMHTNDVKEFILKVKVQSKDILCGPGKPITSTLTAQARTQSIEEGAQTSENVLPLSLPLDCKIGRLNFDIATSAVTAKRGDTITYEMTVKNDGTADLNNIRSTMFRVPNGNLRVSLVLAGSSSECSMNEVGNIVCKTATIQPTKFVSYKILVRLEKDPPCNQQDALTNLDWKGEVQAENAAEPTVNIPVATVGVNCANTPVVGSLTIDGTTVPAEVSMGGSVQYTFSLKNGSAAMSPKGTFVTSFVETMSLKVDGTSPNCKQTDDTTVTCLDIPTLAPGGETKVQLNVVPKPPADYCAPLAPSHMLGSRSHTFDQAGAKISNTLDKSVRLVCPSTNFTAKVTVAPLSTTRGGVVTYELTMGNTGAGAISAPAYIGVSTTDLPKVNFEFLKPTLPAGCAINQVNEKDQNVICQTDGLKPGDTKVFKVQMRVGNIDSICANPKVAVKANAVAWTGVTYINLSPSPVDLLCSPTTQPPTVTPVLTPINDVVTPVEPIVISQKTTLKANIQADSDIVKPGDALRYEAAVQNTGTVSAKTLSLTFLNVPSKLLLATESSVGCKDSVEGNTRNVVCSAAKDLQPGKTYTFTPTFKVESCSATPLLAIKAFMFAKNADSVTLTTPNVLCQQ